MNVLLVGLGSIGKKHVDALLTIDASIRIFALRSFKANTLYKRVENIFSLDEISVKIDFVIISNNTSLHEETILQMLGLGCPLFIEKPVLGKLDNIDNLRAGLEKNKTVTYVACNLRFHPALIFLHDYLQTQRPRINEVNIYCGSYLPDWRPGQDFRETYSARREMGGGAHLDLIHEIDYCTWLFGFPKSLTSVKSDTSSLAIDAVDSARYIFSYQGFTAAITLNYFRRDAKRVIEIVTDERTLTTDLLKNEVKDNRSGEVLHAGPYHFMDSYIHQLTYFISQIKAGKLVMNDFNYAVEVLKLTL